MFSELVDRCVKSAGRPDALADIAMHANETMRKISKKGNWADDTVEESISYPPGQNHVVWEPGVGRARFRREEYVQDSCGAEPTAVPPSRRIRDLDFFYYRSGQSFVIKGGVPPLSMYYYAYQPWLRYFQAGVRPTTFNMETQDWTNPDPALVAQVSNWMLERHNDTVMAGTLNSFMMGKQDARQALHYAKFKEGLEDIQRSEGLEELWGRRRG